MIQFVNFWEDRGAKVRKNVKIFGALRAQNCNNTHADNFFAKLAKTWTLCKFNGFLVLCSILALHLKNDSICPFVCRGAKVRKMSKFSARFARKIAVIHMLTIFLGKREKSPRTLCRFNGFVVPYVACETYHFSICHFLGGGGAIQYVCPNIFIGVVIE